MTKAMHKWRRHTLRGMQEDGVAILETAVVVAITGILAGALVWVISLGPVSPPQKDITDVENSIVGYAVTHQSLPASGWLDPTVIGLPAGNPIWYSGDTRLQARPTTYTPDLFRRLGSFVGADGNSTNWSSIVDSGGANGGSTAGVLDFCATLLQAAQTPELSAGGIPVALVVQRSKTRDTAPPAPSLLPGTPNAQRLASQGTVVAGVGFGEIIARLHCPARLAAAGSAAKSVVAAQDMLAVGVGLQQFLDLKKRRALYSQLSDDFQIGIRSGLLANLAADLVSTTLQLKAIIPDDLDVADPNTLANLVVLSTADVVLLEYIALQFQIISTIDPGMSQENSDAANVNAASAALQSASTYLQQLKQLQQNRMNHYRATIQGSRG